MMGWGMDFAVLLFDNEEENKIADLLKTTLFNTDNSRDLIIRMPKGYLNSEDLISTLDFKNHVLEIREGIPVANSVYVSEKGLPRNFMLSKFLANVKSGEVTMENLDEETTENFRIVTGILKGLK
jgi:hypothetical protein